MQSHPFDPQRHFVIPDIHGCANELYNLIDFIKLEARYNPSVDMLVQGGDKTDRGPNVFEVMEWWRHQLLAYPDNTVCLWGNHELGLVDAAKMQGNLWIYERGNGGNKTLESYGKNTGCYGKHGLGNALLKSGHWDFLKKHMYFYETPDYFFCHSPIPKPVFRRTDRDFRCDIWTCTSSFVEILPEIDWIDHNPAENRLCVYGHVHALKVIPEKHREPLYVVNGGIRSFGNVILLDSGCGCDEAGYLSCLELPARKVYNTRGQVIQL